VIEHEVWINAERSVVFEAITSVAGLDSWWGKAVQAEANIDGVVEFDHGFGEPLKMRVIDLRPNSLVSWRCISEHTEWRNPASEWLGHRLDFELATPEGDPTFDWFRPRLGYPEDPTKVTVLNFRHTGWLSDSRWRNFCNLAWGATLAGLGQYCESRNDIGQ
jgi:uncharacterized protein YndB with AHSA1/START domain